MKKMNNSYFLPNGKKVNWEEYKKFMSQQMKEMMEKEKQKKAAKQIFPAFNSGGW